MFHRLNVPSYYGGLPAGFDYINTPSLSGGSGAPAYMDNKKAGGPNDGTYMVAFGEDATSNFANRGIKAVSENTDILDDLLRRDLAISARTANVTAGSPVSSVTITGQVFVATFGTPNNQDQRDQLISVLDSNDEEILDSSGAKVVAISIVDNNVSSTNLVGTQASGFFGTPTINFNTSIPAGVTYRIYYGERSNLASLPQNAFTTIKIRGAQEVSADIERTLRSLHSSYETTWDAPWDASIRSLTQTGLDGRYRLSTVDTSDPYSANSAGAGGYIKRDGPAPYISQPAYDLSQFGQIGGGAYYPDPIMASWRLTSQRTNVASNYNNSFGGDVGLFQESPFHSTSDVNEHAGDRVAGPLVYDVTPRTFTASTLGGNQVITRITPNFLATVNPDATNTVDGRRTVQVSVSDYLRDGSGNIAIRSTDLIEVSEPGTGVIIGVFRVDTVLSASRMTLRTLPGAYPHIGAANTASNVLLRWLQPTMQLGGRYRDATDGSQGFPYFTVAAPSPAVNAWSSNRGTLNAVFLSAIMDRTLISGGGGSLYNSMAWGGFGSSGYWFVSGQLDGDGSISTTGGKQRFNIIGRRTYNYALGEGGRSVVWDPYVNGSQVHIYTSSALTTVSPVVFSVSTTSGYIPTAGDEFDLFFTVLATTAPGTLSITWPSDFVFSGNDDEVPDGYPIFGPSPATITIHYKFRYLATPSATGWYATRTDF